MRIQNLKFLSSRLFNGTDISKGFEGPVCTCTQVDDFVKGNSHAMTLKPPLRRNNSFHFDNSLGTDLALEETLSNQLTCVAKMISEILLLIQKKKLAQLLHNILYKVENQY